MLSINHRIFFIFSVEKAVRKFYAAVSGFLLQGHRELIIYDNISTFLIVLVKKPTCDFVRKLYTNKVNIAVSIVLLLVGLIRISTTLCEKSNLTRSRLLVLLTILQKNS